MNLIALAKAGFSKAAGAVKKVGSAVKKGAEKIRSKIKPKKEQPEDEEPIDYLRPAWEDRVIQNFFEIVKNARSQALVHYQKNAQQRERVNRIFNDIKDVLFADGDKIKLAEMLEIKAEELITLIEAAFYDSKNGQYHFMRVLALIREALTGEAVSVSDSILSTPEFYGFTEDEYTGEQF